MRPIAIRIPDAKLRSEDQDSDTEQHKWASGHEQPGVVGTLGHNGRYRACHYRFRPLLLRRLYFAKAIAIALVPRSGCSYSSCSKSHVRVDTGETKRVGFIRFEHAVRFYEATRFDSGSECCYVIQQADL